MAAKSESSIRLCVPSLNNEAVQEIDNLIKLDKLRDVNEIMSVEDQRIESKNIDDYIKSTQLSMSSESERIKVESIKYLNRFESIAFEVVNRLDDGTYKLDIITSRRLGDDSLRVFRFGYKMSVKFDLSDVVNTLIQSNELILKAIVGTLLTILFPPLGIKLLADLQKNNVLTEENIKNYLIFKLVEYANKKSDIHIEFT